MKAGYRGDLVGRDTLGIHSPKEGNTGRDGNIATEHDQERNTVGEAVVPASRATVLAGHFSLLGKGLLDLPRGIPLPVLAQEGSTDPDTLRMLR